MYCLLANYFKFWMQKTIRGWELNFLQCSHFEVLPDTHQNQFKRLRTLNLIIKRVKFGLEVIVPVISF